MTSTDIAVARDGDDVRDEDIAPCEGCPPRDRSVTFAIAAVAIVLVFLALQGGTPPTVVPADGGLELELVSKAPSGCPGTNVTILVRAANHRREALELKLTLEGRPLFAVPQSIPLTSGDEMMVAMEVELTRDAIGEVPFTVMGSARKGTRDVALELSDAGVLTVRSCAETTPQPSTAPPTFELPLEALIPSLAERRAKTAALLAACEDKDDRFDRENCIGDAAVEARNVSLCGDLTIEGLRDWCYSTFFAPGGDPSICDNVVGADNRAFCIALVTLDPAVCEQVESPLNRNVCITNLAQNSKDPTLCERISDPTARASCVEACG